MGDDRALLWGHDLESEGLEDWRILYSTLTARFATGSFATGLRLVQLIGDAAEEADHHPDVDLSYPRVDVRLSSHDVGGVTARDVRLARRISEFAAEVGATAEPAAVSAIELALDTADMAAVRPFWAALLGFDQEGDADQITDPAGRHPTIWFQPRDVEADRPSQRWHMDIRVPPEVAEDRVRACMAAGGTMVDDAQAPAYWVIADPEGNRACVCTWQGREAG